MEELGIRSGLDDGINTTETIEMNHDVSLSIDEAQENSIALKEMGVSKCAKVRSILSNIK